jgi:RHS repeat-associated protein
VRHKRCVTRGGDAERFIWDGLALVHRDGSDYLNEPAVGGGNPVASNGKVLFNDMLGSTVAVKGDDGLGMTSMTAFGESSDSGAFFTGKPFVGELGYAFLMRSYRPENGKWQTADPMGYPDGWNPLAYCNNGVTMFVDLWGALIASIYSISQKTLTVYDVDTKDRITLTNVISGDNIVAHQWVAELGPAPIGTYYVVDDLSESNWWELWYLGDSKLDDVAVGPGGAERIQLRLHPGGYSNGCITVPTSAGTAWTSLVNGTDTIEIDDPYAMFPSINKRLMYGTLSVVE